MAYLKKNIKIIIWMIIILLAFLLTLFSYKIYITKYPSIDTLQNTFFANNIIKSGELGFNNKYLQYSYIFGLRTTFVSPEGKNYPSNQLGYIFLLSEFLLLNEKIIFLSNFLIFLLLIFFIFRLCKLVFNEKVSYLTIILLTTFSSLIFWSVLFMNDVPAMTFFFISLFYLFKSINNKDNKSLILFSFFFSFTCFIRYSYILLFPIFLLAFLNYKKFKLNYLLISTFIFILLITSFISYNLINYNYFLGPVEYQSDLILLSPNIEVEKLISNNYNLYDRLINFFNLEVFRNNFNIYILGNFFLISSLSVISLFIILRNGNENQKFFFIISIYIILIFIFLYMGKIWSGYSKNYSLASMYTRYLLPVHILFIILTSNLIILSKKRLTNRNFIMFLGIFMIIFLTFNLTTSFTLINKSSTKSEVILKIDKIINSTPKDSIIFANFYDKFIFPERMTAIYSTYKKEERIELTTDIVKELITKNYPVYFINEDHLKDYDYYKLEEDYFPYFEKNGLNIIRSEDRFYYKIELQST